MSVKPAEQLWLPGVDPDESLVTETGPDYQKNSEQLMERALERPNLVTALRRVERNAGSGNFAGIWQGHAPGDGIGGIDVVDGEAHIWPKVGQGRVVREEPRRVPS